MKTIFYQSYFLIIISSIFAIPATSQQITFNQPSGIEFKGHVRGDEWNNWHETIDGYRIAQDINGVWKYVERVNNNGFILSSIDAHLLIFNISINKHIRPIQTIIPPNHELESHVNLNNLNREEFEVPFLLIDYPNMEYSFELSNLDDLLNEIDYTGTQGQTGSFKDFYIENSYGQFIINSTVLGWFTAAEEKGAKMV